MALPPLNAGPSDTPMPPGAGAPDAGGGAPEDAGGTVFATILKMPDGSFQLLSGDEPEMAGGASDEPGLDPPALLRKLVSMIQGDEGSGEQAGMEAGYNEGEAPPPGPPGMAGVTG